jgi:hypothetical protein
MVGPSLYLEKPVTPRRYLESICEIVGVTATIDPHMVGDSSDSLRDEARNLLDSADAATLEAVLDELRKAEPETPGGSQP